MTNTSPSAQAAEFEERADQLSLALIDSSLADGEVFRHARTKLLARGAKLLVGPRGTGKTHIMRYTYAQAMRQTDKPLALYATFNRYLNLEPLLKKSPDARQRFHSWVLAKLLVSAFDWLEDATLDESILSNADPLFNRSDLMQLVARLERGTGEELYEELGQRLTVDHVLKAVRTLLDVSHRSRAVLLLDDAALSLADEYLVAFFEIFRQLKTEQIAPKASVYPGSTQYGPTFHASHEVEEIHLWLSVEDGEYSQIMGDIAARRLLPEQIAGINPDVMELLKYLSFGVPRTYLRLLRELLSSRQRSVQQQVNGIVEAQTELIRAEYESLGIKLKQFASIVQAGGDLFDKAVQDVATAQSADTSVRNIVLGLQQEQNRSPLAGRMLRFLVEVGLLYPLQPVSHGPDRKYDRYIPHLAFLWKRGAFGRTAWSTGLTTCMQASSVKHPVRREMSTLLRANGLARIKLDLPPCQNCGTARINESQRFCHQCGEELVVASMFEECMQLPLGRIPEISQAMIKRLNDDTQLRSVGDVYASQNASGDLQRANYVGPVRAGEIIRKVERVIEEFLS
ncbi:MAG: zinc ribbon domain-containing protein [Rhodoferax sp.]|nr:zinc ribbon domain-containing protein [Rhodoferax sp.]